MISYVFQLNKSLLLREKTNNKCFIEIIVKSLRSESELVFDTTYVKIYFRIKKFVILKSEESFNLKIVKNRIGFIFEKNSLNGKKNLNVYVINSMRREIGNDLTQTFIVILK